MKYAENIQNGVKSLLTIKLSMLFYNDLTSMLNGWHGQEGEYVWRMSLFASPKQSAIVRIVQGPLKKTCELLRTKGISAQFSLVGSGARNMITRNGDGPYDLDYNLLIMKAEERYWNDLRLLKETVRNALNRAERREFFSDAQDSTSCLTALLHFKDTPNC